MINGVVLMDEELTEICEFDTNINKILSTTIPQRKIYYSDEGLQKHLISSNHLNCIPYLSSLTNLITNADYVGQSKNNGIDSFEVVKNVGTNVLVAIKFDVKKDYLYVASMYEVSQSKVDNRLFSGRLKTYSK